MEFHSVNKLYEKSFRENWDRPALSNYQGVTLHYRDVARRIAKMHIMYEECGLVKGDKVAICSRNQANWGVAFLSALTYGAVPVPILHEFKPGNIHHLVNHSEAKILFVDDVVWEGLSENEMPVLQAVVQINTFHLLFAKTSKITEVRAHLNELFGKKYPMNFTPESLDYYEDSPDELALINYTSGTSGFSKGVMIPYRALWSNIFFANKVLPMINETSNVVAMLPSAHMYGMMFELLFELTVGAHVHFLTRVPSPKIIMQALSEVRPNIVIAVPLIIEKVYKSKLKPILEKNGIKFLMHLPVLDHMVMKKICNELISAFGGQFEEVIIGGAAFNKEVESFFKKIAFPFTVGYGMTECAPIITYADWKVSRLYSCGQVAPNMEIRIDSEDPENIPGEVLVKGMNVFLGYFKNPEATESAFTKDGWFRTGDMGVMDKDGYLYLKGRSKCMILGPSGQNIYPEEIESVLNNMPYVVDSLVVEDKGSLTALIYPDFHQGELDGLNSDSLKQHIEESLVQANHELPNYARIKKVEIMPEDFERTPKRSIKRYLYQRN
ncbi:MAG: AMP-binding protein [Bacteroidetes bacterium]|uniref:AMP-binding protein n=1 Tax=Candidatus Cryptobacteroides intestinigallinarum TaxID=2840767 RepID=A0A9D9HJF9_9BACT|nr:AMP-binding protein [Candidatus Cryptobacteroides intestinigallinarum]